MSMDVTNKGEHPGVVSAEWDATGRFFVTVLPWSEKYRVIVLFIFDLPYGLRTLNHYIPWVLGVTGVLHYLFIIRN